MHTLNRRQALRFALATLTVPVMATVAMADGHAETHTVTIKGFEFSPAALTVNAGDKVVFVNEDGAPHTATASNGSFDTGRLNRGQEAALTFAAAGSYDYFCAFHPMMKANITVN